MKWNNFFVAILFGTMFCACSGDKTAGTSEESEGITAIRNLDVAGVTQKGPFVKGSIVTVQGIDCKTLKLTDERFEGVVKNDKGEYVVDNVTLSSTCALFEVSGYYRSELSGKKSSKELTLHALTDLKDRKNVNINLLTNLEYERLMYLVAEKGMSFAAAKAQAEKEVLATFEIKGKFEEFENMNIFENGDGNAALLAVSVLMQSDADVAALAKRMENFSNDFAEDGEWNDEKTKTEIVKWAASVKDNGKLDTIRKNVESMNNGEKVAEFETFVTDIIKDMTLASSSSSSKIVIQSSSGNSTSSTSSPTSSSTGSNNITKESYLNPDVNYGEMVDPRDGQVYKTITLGSQTWMAQNLNYDYKGSKSCYEQDSIVDCSFGRYYSWAMAIDSAALRTTVQKRCGYERTCDLTETIRGVCPEGWHLPDTTEFKAFFDYVVKMTGDSSSATLKTVGEWTPYVPEGDSDYNPHITEATNAIGFSIRPSGCYYCQEDNRNGVDIDNKIKCHFAFIHELTRFWTSNDISGFYAYSFVTSNDNDVMRAYQRTSKLSYYSVRCVKGDVSSVEAHSSDSSDFDWTQPKASYLNPKIKYDSIVDSRDGQVYKTVKIGKYNWMAENLNYTDSVRTPNLKENNWCYGNKSENCGVAGRLYSWSAVIAAGEHECGVGMSCKFRNRVQGICPSGWHLPDTSEWNELISAVDGRTYAGKMLKSQSGWLNEGNGLDAFGFSAIPGGARVGSVGQEYEFEGWNAYFWTSTEYDSDKAYSMNMDTGLDGATYGSASKDYGFSVRCIENYTTASSSSSLSSSSRQESSSSGNFDWSVRKFEYLNTEKGNYDEFKDSRDGKIYMTVKVGDQVWMAENLNYDDSVKTPSLKGKSWCYNDKELSCYVAGRLYTWAAAIDSVALASDTANPMTCGFESPCALSGRVQGICPNGWHLPDTTEWNALFNAVGDNSNAGAVLKSRLGWVTSDFPGTDDVGFSAIPAGMRSAEGKFSSEGTYTVFFSSNVDTRDDKAYVMHLYYFDDLASFFAYNKRDAYSIRCVKD